MRIAFISVRIAFNSMRIGLGSDAHRFWSPLRKGSEGNENKTKMA